MEPIDYLRAVRRRWAIVLAAVIVALIAGWLTTEAAPPAQATTSYQATAILLAPEGADGLGRDTIAALVTIGEVPGRVAEEIDHEGDPRELVARVTATVDETTSLLNITAVAPTEHEATRLANTFTGQLIGYLEDRSVAGFADQQESLQQQMKELRTQIRELDRRISNAASSEAEALQVQRQAKFDQMVSVQNAIDGISLEATGTTQLQVVQSAVAQPVAEVGFQPPESRTSRMALAALVGILGGAALALLLERYDRRIWTKKEAERRFGYPVLSEIPQMPWWRRRALRVVAAEEPRSQSADAYRRLGAEIVRAPSPSGDGQGPRTILVVSGAPGEGKTTVVANLASAFAQLGRGALILSCDFSRPRIHELLRISEGPGLTDGLREGEGQILNGRVKRTFIEGVSLVPSGSRPELASGLLTSRRMHQALGEASQSADVVLIDSAPVLATSDALHLLESVDAVLIVARAGKTTAEQAERTAELLRRHGTPVLGIALTGSSEAPLTGRYYTRDPVRPDDGVGFSPTGVSPGTGGTV